MKSFLKYVLATFTGLIITMLLVLLIFIGIVAHFSNKEKAVKIEPHTILLLKLDQPIVDRKPSTPYNLKIFANSQNIGLNEVLDNVKKAKEDPNIDGIHLDLTFVAAGLGTIEEIRNALLDFKKSGKFVTVYSETLTQGAYYLATAADKIYFYPMGFFNFAGMRAMSPFIRNTLKKLDIEPTIIRCGAYKSFGETFTEEKYSDANREQLKELINSIWTDICNKISNQRGIPVQKLNEIADKLLLKDAKAAYDLKFVDSLLYRDQLLSILKKKTNVEESKDLNTVTLSQYNTVPKTRSYKGLAKDKIAIVYASGDIYPGDGGEDNIGSDKFGKAIRKARRDSSIKAIVVRVNSPGGSAMASDVIWRELSLARKSKPVVVSMGDVAASGGYYISCMADTILTDPNTITGSIGVFSIFMNTKGFFNKLGITFDVEKTNEYADFMSGVRAVKPGELDYWQNSTDNMYKVFMAKVSEGRNIPSGEVSRIAQGRIWSGTDALKLKLVDKIGGLEDAVQIAKNMAHLDEKYRIVELPEQENALEKLLNELTDNTKIKILGSKLGLADETVKNMKNMLENQGILIRMPFDVSFY
jgi:protease IV